jgi:hypothetical protein
MTEYVEFNPLCPTSPREKMEKYRINNNKIYDVVESSIRIVPEIYVPNSGAYDRKPIENIEISGNIFSNKNNEYSAKTSLYITSGRNIVIKNNDMKQTSMQMLHFYMRANNVVIDNNIFKPGVYDYMIYFQRLYDEELLASNVTGDVVSNFIVSNNKFMFNPILKLIHFDASMQAFNRSKNIKIINNENLYCDIISTAHDNLLYNPVQYERNIYYKNDALIPDKFNFYKGDVINFDVALDLPTYKICTAHGTKGVVDGLTGTTSTATTHEITVNNGTLLNIGNYINIASINYKGWVIGKNGNVIQVSPKLTQQITTTPITLNNPTFINGFTPTTTP